MSLERRESRLVEGGADSVNAVDWSHCLAELADQIPDQQFRTWIAPLELSQSGFKLTLLAPNRFIKDFVQDKFADRVVSVVRQVSGESRVELSFGIKQKGLGSASEGAPRVVGIRSSS